jgi:hypothetical protein
VKAAVLFFVLAVTASGSIVSTNVNPRLREIGATYFDALDQSQVWINVAPELPKPDPAPLRQIARATDVTLDALGFSMLLPPADLAAWRVFIHTVEDGVVVRP